MAKLPNVFQKGVDTKKKYIQDPDNPYASIPNPWYVGPANTPTNLGDEPIEPHPSVDNNLPSDVKGGAEKTPEPFNIPEQTGGSSGTGTTQGEDPLTKFNLAILDMLKTAQGAGADAELYKQQRALQREAIERQSTMTPEELRVLSPSQQQAIRSGKMAALEPEIDAVAAEIKARDSRLTNFENLLGQVRSIGGDLLKNISPSPEVVDGYVNMIRAGGNFTSVPTEIRNSIVSKMTEDDWNAWDTARQEAETSIKDIKEDIIKDIDRINKYELESEGFRERYIESLVSNYGEEWRDYITAQTYQRTPDLEDEEETGEEVSFDEKTSTWAEEMQKGKEKGADRETAERELISFIKGELGLTASSTIEDFPEQYRKAVEEILVAIYGSTGGQKLWPGGIGGWFGTSQKELREKYGL